ncbi:MAG: hypothetical protein HC898_07420 [Phycisphaerales bacterium]|nr:hypothetical protein [Phycisphaerales bacterium]
MKLLAMLAVLCLSTVIHGAGLPEGYLDVTTMGADATGKADSTAAIQSAINKARDEHLAVWFPAGEYLITNRLVADQQPDKDPDNPCVLMGSTVNPQKRATLVLAASSPGFNDPTKRRAMLHFVNIGTPEEESGNTSLYNHAVVGLNFRVMPGNDGAIALRMQGAEGCTIQDVHIDLTQGGHTGIWGVPASGGSTHTVTVIGGKVGIDTRNLGDPENGGGGSQPQPVVSGATLLNQTEFAVRSSTRGSLVLVGCRIERNTPGPVIWLKHHWAGQPFDASLQLVDSVIDYAQPDALNTVIQMDSKHTGRSFVLENCYLRHAQNIWRSDIAGNPQGWLHMQRLAVHVPPPSHNWGKPSEPIYVDGQVHDDVYVQSTSDVAPPVDLTTRHHLPR